MKRNLILVLLSTFAITVKAEETLYNCQMYMYFQNQNDSSRLNLTDTMSSKHIIDFSTLNFGDQNEKWEDLGNNQYRFISEENGVKNVKTFDRSTSIYEEKTYLRSSGLWNKNVHYCKEVSQREFLER